VSRQIVLVQEINLCGKKELINELIDETPDQEFIPIVDQLPPMERQTAKVQEKVETEIGEYPPEVVSLSDDIIGTSSMYFNIADDALASEDYKNKEWVLDIKTEYPEYYELITKNYLGKEDEGTITQLSSLWTELIYNKHQL
jgi:hypothetical protein